MLRQRTERLRHQLDQDGIGLSQIEKELLVKDFVLNQPCLIEGSADNQTSIESLIGVLGG